MESFGRELLRPVIHTHPRATMTHIADLPTHTGVATPWPEWVPGWLKEVLVDRGIENLWTHQAATANLTREGVHCVVATDTASGKSPGYLLPVLTGLSATPTATALYLSPTKALSADQLDTAHAMALVSLSSLISLCDGDTPQDARRAIRDHTRWVFTNPDILHVSVPGNHVRWARVLYNLYCIIVDECHAYQSVFGASVVQILRHPLRLSRGYGASPIVVFASATANDPADQARRLISKPVEAVTEDGTPVGERTIVLWEPSLLPDLQGENGAPVHRPVPTEAADIVTDPLVEGARTLAFTRSRDSAEKVALGVYERLKKRRRSDIVECIEPYRAGYLAEERRDIGRMLGDDTLLGVATTNTLELGTDVGGFDAVVQAGFLGTVASFWRQASRAGRRDQGALAVLVARDDPMDTYLVHNPSALLGRPVEKTIFNPHNPHVVWSHLYCTAVERPAIISQPQAWGTLPVAEDMVSVNRLHKRTREGQEPVYYPTDRDERSCIATTHDAVNVRGGDSQEVAIVDQADGRLFGTIDLSRAMQQVCNSAIYLHRGGSYLVNQLDSGSLVALVRPEQPRYSTGSRTDATIRILDVDSMHRYQSLQVTSYQAEIFHQVTSYLHHLDTDEILDNIELNYPPQRLVTHAMAYTVPKSTLRSWGMGSDIAPKALHAAEHAAIGMLPLIATCDRWDIDDVSTVMHADIQQPTVFVYDGHLGGVGFADRGYEAFAQWVRTTRDTVTACECKSGCPSRIQSPKCGNGNGPLDKVGAIKVLSGVSHALNDGQ